MIKLPTFLYKQFNLFLIFFFIYTAIAFIPKPPGMTLTNGDEPHYLVMTYNLIHNRNLENLDKIYEQKIYKSWYGADTIEGHLIALPDVKDKVYAYHQVGLSILLIPGFYIGQLAGVIISLTAIVSLGMVFMFKTFQYYLSKELSLFTTLLIGFSLPVGVFSNLIYPETIILTLTTLVMMIILHKNFKLNATNTILLALIFVYLPIFHLKFITLSILFLIYINLVSFKNDRIKLLMLDVLFILGFSLYFTWLNSYYDWMLADALHAISANVSMSLVEIPSGLLGILVDRENGILIYSPYYIYIIYSILPIIKKSLTEPLLKAAHTLFPLFITVAFTAFFTMFPYVMGGANPSGRYNLPVIAAMGILLGIGFQTQLRIKYQRYIIGALAFYSLIMYGLLSHNPLLGIPGNMENKVFFFLFKENAHIWINVYLPNLSKYHRVIPLIDYIKGLGVFAAILILTGWGSINQLKRDIKTIRSNALDLFSQNNKLWSFSTRRNRVKKTK